MRHLVLIGSFAYLLTACASQQQLPQTAQPVENEPRLEVEKSPFDTKVSGDVLPWTHLDFYDDPEHFQFAIVSDRTGGVRRGIFADAVDKLNLMMPEFVMSVGDLIPGYSRDMDQLNAEWDEFLGVIGNLKPPFFYLPGNHDISNEVMQADWERRFGKRYYHFTYKDVLFITMDTNDGDGVSISDEQAQYVTTALAENPDVRWTFIFMHHPIWGYANNASFLNIEKALEGRQYTVFAGHTHHYFHRERNKNNYFVLATTGGGSQLRGPRFGEYDHITWITMSENGPVMANLKLDGIIPYDIVNQESNLLARSLINTVNITPTVLCNDAAIIEACTAYFTLSNQGKKPVNVEGAFYHHHQVNLDIPRMNYLIASRDQQHVAIKTDAHKPMQADQVEPLTLGWAMNVDDEQYGDIQLEGDYQIPLQSSTTNNLSPSIPLFVDELEVNLPEVQPGLTWVYTLDGSEPTYESKAYSEPILISKETTIKVKLFNQEGQSTLTEEKTYSPTTLRDPVSLSAPKEGLKYSYYEGEWKFLPDFSMLEPVESGIAKDFDVSRMAKQENHYGFVFEGFVDVPSDGLYEFSTRSDDGSKLFIHGQEVVDNDGSHSIQLRSGAIGLKKGLHPVKILYFEDFDGERLILGYRFSVKDRWTRLRMNAFVHE